VSLRSVLRGAGADKTNPMDRGQVEGGKFSAEGNADGRGVCDPAYLGGWARDGDLFVGILKKNHGGQLSFSNFSLT
jgi:hypothetical protein